MYWDYQLTDTVEVDMVDWKKQYGIKEIEEDARDGYEQCKMIYIDFVYCQIIPYIKNMKRWFR